VRIFGGKNEKIMACNCKNKKSGIGMARRKINVAQVATSAAKAGAGFIGGKLLTANVGYLRANPLIGSGAQILAGALVASQSKNFQEVGIGMAANGMLELLVSNVPDVANQLGISGIGQIAAPASGSIMFPGVAGPNKSEQMINIQ
jgi:hypothetical protein